MEDTHTTYVGHEETSNATSSITNYFFPETVSNKKVISKVTILILKGVTSNE